jgi:hypothetical protein
MPRWNDTGRAFAGSQGQIQFYVNKQPSVLNQAISDAFKTSFSLRWVSPLSSDGYREYWDSAFLEALGLPQHCKELSRFWPSGGPHWDALACVEKTGGVLLVEAKSHVPEIFGNGCGAEAASSLQKIAQAIAATKEWLHVSDEADWKGPLYQTANRLAHLYFFTEILRIEAWLVNVYFTDDCSIRNPTPRTSWNVGIADVKKSLGIGAVSHYADVFLPAV